MPNRTIAPPIIDAVDFELVLPRCDHHVLSNGVEVYSLNMGDEDVLQINWVFYAGAWYEKKKSLAAATNYLMKNGTSGKTAFEINEHFDYYGAYVNRSCYTETSEITLHCLNKHVHALIPVIAEMFTDATFPEEELAIYKQNSLQRLKVNLQKSEFVAGRLIDSYLFGEKHPYGKYNNAEDYEALNREDLVNFYEEYYRKGRMVIFAAGKLPENMIAELEKYFGSLPVRNHRETVVGIQHKVEPATQKKYRIINDPNGVQAAIRLLRPFPNRHHPDFQKAQVINNVLGGFFGSRLMGNIREDKGYTYGIYSYLLNFIHESGWMITTEAGRDVAEATVQEIYNEMELLREEEIDDEELMMTRNFIIGTVLGDLDGPFQVIGRWKNMILNGVDEAYFYQSLQVVRSITAKELQELANTYLQPDDFYELVVI